MSLIAWAKCYAAIYLPYVKVAEGVSECVWVQVYEAQACMPGWLRESVSRHNNHTHNLTP